MKRKPLIALAGALLAVGLIMAIAGLVYLRGPGSHPKRTGVERLVVPNGASAWKVGYLMEEAGLIESPRRFAWHLRWRGESDQLRSGTYDIPRSASMRAMADRILLGEEVEVEITLPEGWTARQVAGALAEKGICDSAQFMGAIRDPEMIKAVGLDVPTLEGYLFPETYLFRLNLDAAEVVRPMVSLFEQKVGPKWLAAARRDPLGLHGIVTLASVVQGEFQLAGETDDIAALYRNRLRRNMRLQADPTVQYLLPAPRRLTFADLRLDSPYNTYRYRGLPPGPINNPGLAALRSALDPPERPWIYMVARGDGGHTFTTNYPAHLEAKKRLDAIRRQVDRERRAQGQK